MLPSLRFTRARGGVMIAYTMSGDGPPLVWLPPVPFTDVGEQWRVPSLRSAYERLGEHVTLVLYDGRGSGQSQRNVGSIDLDTMLDDLHAVISDAGLESVALLGYYSSVAPAVAFAARHPERVTHLVLFGGAIELSQLMSTPTNQALTRLFEQDWDISVDAAIVSWMGWGDEEEKRRLAALYRGSTTPSIAKATFEAARAIDVNADVGAVRAPALVLHRQGERLTPLELSQRLAAALPDGRLVRLEGSAGGLLADDLEGDLSVIVEFLTGERPRPRAFEPEPDLRPTPEELESGVFISCSERRKEAVAWPFRDRLAERGTRAFIVSDEPRPSGTWTPEEKVDAFLERSEAVVVFATADLEAGEDRFTRPNIGDEIGRARSKRHLRDRVCVLKEHGVTLPSNIDPAYESLDLSDLDTAFDRALLQLSEWGVVDAASP
jgi:pimeloyl-ACP methyl ester carboxylesterase